MGNDKRTLSEIVTTGLKDAGILVRRALNPYSNRIEGDYKKMTSKEKEEYIKNLCTLNPTGEKFMSNPTEKEWNEYLRGINEERKRRIGEPEGRYPLKPY